jgi:hypothetical protein
MYVSLFYEILGSLVVRVLNLKYVSTSASSHKMSKKRGSTVKLSQEI